MKRSRWSRIVLLAVSTAVPILPGFAGPEPGPGAVVRWPEAAAAVERLPSLVEATARQRGASGAVSAAGALPNPAISLSAGDAVPRGGGAGRREWGLSVQLPLETLATRWSRVAAAEASEEAARQDARTARRLALRELRRSFVDLVHRQAVVETGEELETQVAQLAALVGKRSDRGEGRPTEVLRVEIELERLRSALQRSRAVAEAQRLRLSTLIGVPVARAEGNLAQALPLPSLDALRERILASSPLLLASQARLQAASEEASAERWERFPRVSIGGARVEELDRTASTVSATIAVPLWNWNLGRIRQAEAAQDAERARLDAATREISAGVSDAWQGCAAGQGAVRRFQGELLPRAEASARTLGRAFELGEAGLLDVLDSRRVLLDTRREYLDLLLDMQHACGDLAALAGLELP